MAPKSPDPQAQTVLFSWQHSWPALVVLVLQLLALAWYASKVRGLGNLHKSWSPWATASFVVGLAVFAYSYEGGIAHYERSNFTAHVVQLLLLTAVAPPLLSAGRPLRLALLTTKGWLGRALVTALHSNWARAVTHPLTGFAVGATTMYVYLLTPLYALSERHPVFLAYVHLQFLVSGTLMWWQVVGRDSLPRAAGFGWRFAVVLLSLPAVGLLGLLVASAKAPLFALANTLSDTHQGGNVLWQLWSVFLVVALGYLFVEWAREEQQRAVLADRQLDAALAVARSAQVEQLHDSPRGGEA